VIESLGIPVELIAAMLAVLVASLLGSGHCAGMCGPIMLFAISGMEATTASRGGLHIAYHAGRGVSYVVLGAIAGAVGTAFDFGGSFIGFQRGAAVVFGVLMMLAGISLLAAHLGVRMQRLTLPAGHQKLVERLHRVALSMPPLRRAWAVGQLTPLLPCGWLYLYVLAAAGTGNLIWGGAILLAFWVGTVPILAGLGLGIQWMAAPLRKHLPLVSGLAVLIIGSMAVLGRVSMPTMTPADRRDILATSSVERFAVPDQTPACCGTQQSQEASKP